MKNKVRGKLRKNKAKDTTQHGAVRSDRRIRKRQGTTKVQKEGRNLQNRRPRDGMAMTATPSTEDRPFGLVVYAGGGSSAAGKLTSHCRSETEGSGGSLDIRYSVR